MKESGFNQVLIFSRKWNTEAAIEGCPQYRLSSK